MKLLIIFVLLIPFTLQGQTLASYKQAMENFKIFYNAGQGDRINSMFENDNSKLKATRLLWTNSKAAEALNNYGRLESFKFVGVDTVDINRVYVFQTVFSKKGKKTTTFSLNKNNQFSTFRFDANSDEINRLLKHAGIANK